MDTFYDLVMKDNDFVLYANQKPLLTKNGNVIFHNNARVLRATVLSEMIFYSRKLSPLKLLERLVDAKANTIQLFGVELEATILEDPLLISNNEQFSSFTDELFQNNSFLIDFIFLNSSSLASSLRSFLIQKDENQTKSDFVSTKIKELGIEEKVLLEVLSTENQCGILIHLLLLSGFLSVNEYATGIIILQLKSKHKATTDILKHGGLSSFGEIQQEIVSNAQMAVDFLTMCSSKNKISVIEEIIKRGEDAQTEFKSTVRWDIRQAKKNPAIEHAALKTICAFLNSEGGDLLIGVRDDGNIEGIETDQFENEDRFLLHLWNLIKTCMGHEVVEWVKTSLQKFGNKTVCRVNCQKAKSPVFLNQKGFDEAFYVRVGPASSNLEIRSALKYIEQHFHNQ